MRETAFSAVTTKDKRWNIDGTQIQKKKRSGLQMFLLLKRQIKDLPSVAHCCQAHFVYGHCYWLN